MSFYTSLTGLNGATADIAAISNNIANVGTTGFKLSRAEFGDIFATSPLQNANSAVGSGTILKSVQQQFTQGNIKQSQNALDLAISGQGFFTLKPSLTSTQSVFTRNGSFSVNSNRYVVDSQGQYLQVFPVNNDGSVIATGIASAQNLQLPSTSGLPKASSAIQLGLNLPADATIIPKSSSYTEANPYKFDKANASTYNQSTSITIYDSLGNPTIATIYYVKTSNASTAAPTNKWETHVFVGDTEVNPALITAKDDQAKTYYINKFGQITTDPQTLDPTFNANAAHPLYKQDDQTNKTSSTAATLIGAIQNTVGFDFGSTDANAVTIITDPAQYSLTREGGATGANPPYWGKDMFTISVDGSQPQSVSITAGSYTGEKLAAEMTRAVNAKYSDGHYFRITDSYREPGGAVIAGNDVVQVNMAKLAVDGSSVPLSPPLEIDLNGTAGSTGTPPVGATTQQLKYQDLNREQLVALAQTKVDQALNARHLEFGKTANWPSSDAPAIKVGYDVATRSLTFTADPAQLGPDANEPESRFNSLQVFNPTGTVNDLGIPAKTASTATLIRANSFWSGEAALPAGAAILDPTDQRTGVKIEYNKDTRQFSFSSGTTGEASSINVGRAVLATSADVQTQVNSFDLSNLQLAAGQALTFEVDGRVFSYTSPVALPAGATTFLQGIQQAFPVSFSDTTHVTLGNATTADVQSLNTYGNVFNGDQYEVDLQKTTDVLGAGQLVTTASLRVNVSGILSTDTATVRTDKLVAAINASLAAEGMAGVSVTKGIKGDIQFTYANAGVVTPLVSMKQTVRGPADGGFITTTVAASATKTTTGAVGVAEVQRSALSDGLLGTATIAVGDKFAVSIPGVGGTHTNATVTVGGSGGTAGLLTALNAISGSPVTFSMSGANLVATYSTTGVVSGTFSLVQVPTTALSFTEATVVAAPTQVTVGTATTNQIQSTVLQSATAGSSLSLNVGDKYTVTIPMPDGSISTVTAVIPTLNVGETALQALARGLNGTSLSATVTFTVDATTNKLISTYNQLGAVTGAMTVEQTAVQATDPMTGALSTVAIRPDPIGPFGISAVGNKLLFQGNPDGSTFRLNVAANGVPMNSEPVGANGSRSATGVQIGQSVAPATSPKIFTGNNDLLGIGSSKAANVQKIAGTGLPSTAAVALGSSAITPMNQTFFLNESLNENKMTFTVDGITGSITLPIQSYTGDTFAAAIQQRVNEIQDPKSLRTVDGVKVHYNPDQNRLEFTSGTTGADSQINVVGAANFGLSKVTQTQGTVPTITNLTQATDALGNKLYVGADGTITTQAPSTNLQNWYPLYLTSGELTFDTAGKLISPKQGVVYSPFDPKNGSNLLNLTIDYGKYSTQYTQPFSVQSLTQDGYPSGSLNGLNIDASGTVRANYTNGQTTALGKVMLANFANPNGLKQIGNANYVATSTSGQATLGQPGGDGLGSIQAGALENSNVDITAELVNLITAQRNFQANAKAIETDTTLTNTIIQIRG